MILITESNTLKLDYTQTQNALQLSLAHVELLLMTIIKSYHRMACLQCLIREEVIFFPFGSSFSQ